MADALATIRRLVDLCGTRAEKAAFEDLAYRVGEPVIREQRRQAYVRQHAPTVLAGYLATNPQGVSDGDIRAAAIRGAGLLFDETEPNG